MAYFQAKARARRSAWILTSIILLAVAVVRRLPQPWRGIIDAGVVAGLGFGAIALGVAAIRALREGTSPGDPELDEVR
jgi:ABC-type Fe3+ transport system permease subunit